eukprot:356990-Chlamydomonas_euryale.AAC.3
MWQRCSSWACYVPRPCAVVSTATNGQDALKMLRDKNVADFDLVLSDVMMPGAGCSCACP